MKSFNPFARLSPEALKTVFQNRMRAKRAEDRLKAIVGKYREIVRDKRYEEIRQHLEGVLGEVLEKLVDEASTCSKCSPTAHRVRLLSEIVSEPYNVSWYANQRERMEELAPQNGNGEE